MRIISKFRDYYDGVMNMGMDLECPYIREQKEIALNVKDSNEYVNAWKRGQEGEGTLYDIHNWEASKFGRYAKDEVRNFFLIGYCGKIYPCIKITTPKETVFQYKKDKIKDEKFKKRYYHMGTEISFFDKDWSKFEKYFLEYKTPIFVVRPKFFEKSQSQKRVLITNCELRCYDFMKKKDPYTAFQDIYQYISGVIGVNQKPIIELSDKSKRQKHQMDDKYSFRKEPKKSKKKN